MSPVTKPFSVIIQNTRVTGQYFFTVIMIIPAAAIISPHYC